MSTPPPTPAVSYYVVRVLETDRGMLAVYAERGPDGRKVSHATKQAAFAAAGVLGGRSDGFRVLAACHDENGTPCGVSYPRGDNS
jgi:hypothetical protein